MAHLTRSVNDVVAAGITEKSRGKNEAATANAPAMIE